MDLIITIILNALRIGSIYALVALGYTMVYGIIRLINFAHGDFIMVGGYAMVFFVPILLSVSMPAWLSVLCAVVICALVGILVEIVAYRPIRSRGTKMSALITAIAMSLFLQNLAQAIFTATDASFKDASGTTVALFGDFKGVTIFGYTIDAITFFTIVISFVLMAGLMLLVKKTKLGRSMRAVSEDKTAAIVTGVNVNRTIVITFAIGAALAAFAALAYCGFMEKVNPTIGGTLGLKAFVAAVLGGIGSIPGAMLGGLVIGVVETLAKVSPLSPYTDAIVFLILIVVLLVKPAGLLGKNVGEKV